MQSHERVAIVKCMSVDTNESVTSIINGACHVDPIPFPPFNSRHTLTGLVNPLFIYHPPLL